MTIKKTGLDKFKLANDSTTSVFIYRPDEQGYFVAIEEDGQKEYPIWQVGPGVENAARSKDKKCIAVASDVPSALAFLSELPELGGKAKKTVGSTKPAAAKKSSVRRRVPRLKKSA